MVFNRLVRLLIVFIFLFFSASNILAETQDQFIKVALRSIGHEYLLQINDSTSQILPIEDIDGRYAIRFEREFSFHPDLLLFSVFKVMEQREMQEHFLVEVEKCDTNLVVHSFEASLMEDNILTPCRLRQNGEQCYVFYFTVTGVPSVSISDTSDINFSLLLSLLCFVVVLLVIFFFIFRKKKLNTSSGVLKIGKYYFDQKGMVLTLKEQSVQLSGKESDLLLLLFSNENKTLERNYILKEIWGDEGDYVGRTLDVFISKLRKKLEADSNLKIINVRGVGYRFVIHE